MIISLVFISSHSYKIIKIDFTYHIEIKEEELKNIYIERFLTIYYPTIFKSAGFRLY